MKFSVNLGQGSDPNHCLQGYIKTRTFWLCRAQHIISMPGLWEPCRGSQFGRWTSCYLHHISKLLPALCYAPSNFSAVSDQLPPLSLTANSAGSTSYSSWLSTLPARLYTTMAKQPPPLLSAALHAELFPKALPDALWPAAFLGSNHSWNKA